VKEKENLKNLIRLQAQSEKAFSHIISAINLCETYRYQNILKEKLLINNKLFLMK
jgi:hypothetical protein